MNFKDYMMDSIKKVQALSGKMPVDRIVLVVLALFCGIMAAMVDTIRVNQSLIFNARCVWYTIIVSLLFIALVLLGERFIIWLGKDSKSNKSILIRIHRLFSFKWGYRQFLLIAAFILLCWIPYLLLSYPGILWYDTGQQLMQWFHQDNTFTDGSSWSDHHPVFDTLFFGVFAEFGKVVGSVDFGLFICSVVLSILSASSFSTVIIYCRRLGASWRSCFIGMIIFALFPVVPIFSISLVKDSIFMPFFVWFAILCIEIVRSRGEVLKHYSVLVAFILIALMASITKKTGFYVVVLCCLLLLCAVFKKYHIQIGAVLIVVCSVIMFFMPKILFPAFGIKEGGKQEILSIPFQQSALEVKRHKADMDTKDLDTITAVLGDDVADRYQWWAADNVKGYSWDSSKDKYLGDYVRTWVHGLVKHPVTYIEAYIALQEGWLGVPSYGENGGNDPLNLLLPVFMTGSDHTLVTHAEEMGMSAHGYDYHVKQVENTINKVEQIPLLNLVFSKAIWSTWMFLFIVYEWIRSRRKDFVCLAPYAVSFLFLWISPATVTVEGIRYVMPMVILTPLMWGLLVSKKESSALTVDDK